jgi:Protein of unknown function (DUF1236)
MRRFLSYCAVAAIVCLSVSRADAEDRNAANPGAMTQSTSPTAAQKPRVPPLALSQAQRERIRQAVSSQDTEVTFALKGAKSAEGFEPSVGAKVPSTLKLHPLPQPLTYQMQALKRYTYIKFKHQVLIVNPMTRKIVDMFSES